MSRGRLPDSSVTQNAATRIGRQVGQQRAQRGLVAAGEGPADAVGIEAAEQRPAPRCSAPARRRRASAATIRPRCGAGGTVVAARRQMSMAGFMGMRREGFARMLAAQGDAMRSMPACASASEERRMNARTFILGLGLLCVAAWPPRRAATMRPAAAAAWSAGSKAEDPAREDGQGGLRRRRLCRCAGHAEGGAGQRPGQCRPAQPVCLFDAQGRQPGHDAGLQALQRGAAHRPQAPRRTGVHRRGLPDGRQPGQGEGAPGGAGQAVLLRLRGVRRC